MSISVGRFAPSPTGPLHAGSLLAALGSWLWTKHAGGQWHVRIEDVDRAREVPGASAMQLAALELHGLRADGEIVRQSDRGALYSAALEQLLSNGHAFECHCSRAALDATGGIHRTCIPGLHRPDPSVRLRVPDGLVIEFDDAVHGRQMQQLDHDVGDFVLRRADGDWAYQLAVVVDDASQAVTEVVRGADLLDSTPRQIFLQQQLGLPTPRYAHLPLVVDTAGRKLGKSQGAEALVADTPIASLERTWRMLGQSPFGPVPTPTAWLEIARECFVPSRVGRDIARVGPNPCTTVTQSS